MSLALAHDELVGRSFGEFVLRERIGEGGFGAVYRATQPALDRQAVVKVLLPRWQTSRAATERFLREAKLATKLDHPYAAHIYAFGAEPDGVLWIAMELIRGTPLDQVLRSQGPLPLERFVPLLDRICEVVHTAHEQGIVHRDLKPANVMVLARAGRLLPKLLDFGIAKALAETRDDREAVEDTLLAEEQGDAPPGEEGAAASASQLVRTQRGVVVGSPPYMAPEQWADAGLVGAASDLYALGVLAFECLTGKPPFVGRSMIELAYSHANRAVPPLGARFPEALDKVLAKVLAKRSEDRYGDALAFATAFRAASGIGDEPRAGVVIDAAVREATLNGAPQPIAEAIAAVEAARNAHHARDAIAQAARTISRFLGLLALACRSRVSTADEPPAIAATLRALHRGSISDVEWLELARTLTRAWLDRRDAYPIPELVDAMHERGIGQALAALAELRDFDAADEGALYAHVDAAVAQLVGVLEDLAFLRDYSLVVMRGGGQAERWMGMHRSRRTTTAIRGEPPAAGTPLLIGRDHAPLLSLAPVFQVAPSSPGAPLELFLFEGRDARGARLVALPTRFERHDDAVWDWFRTHLASSQEGNEAVAAEETTPYRGLAPFGPGDASQFFGREAQVDAFVNRLRVQPLLAVVGRSGAGKSSFVHAGVLPALPDWRAISLRPGPVPLAALLARLEHAGLPALERSAVIAERDALGRHLRADAASRGPLVLVIDQLEEMFTLCQDEDERRVFAEAIASAARDADDPVRVIFTLRDDFLVRSEQVPVLRNRIGQGLQLLTVPVAEDLVRIVVEPARRAGYELEGTLATDMVAEVADQPGALASISFTAAKLWELRDRQFKQLTRAAYDTLGGVGGALARHADQTLDAMAPEQRALAREAFRHLVTSQSTRAVLPRNDLLRLLGDTTAADRVIEALVAARLLVASENEAGTETIEIVHEALLVTWPRLVEWRREDAEGARFREQLRAAAAQWAERGRGKDLLWRGDALADFTRWRALHAGPLTDIEAAFATSSTADATRRRRVRRGLLAAAFAILAVGIVVLWQLNGRAEEARRGAAASAEQAHQRLLDLRVEQGRQALLANDPMHALVYLSNAYSAGARGAGLRFMIARATSELDTLEHVLDHGAPVRAVALSPDERTVATAGSKHVRLWDATTGRKLRELVHEGSVWSVAFSPDSKRLVTASDDHKATLWDTSTGAIVRTFDHPANVRAARFSPDGKWVATVATDHAARVWEADSGRLVAAMPASSGYVRDAMFRRDGTRLLTWAIDGARLWKLPEGELVASLTHAGPVTDAQFSPDGALIATASFDRTAKLWNADGTLLRTLKHVDQVQSIAFSPDGTRVVTGTDDSRGTVWDVATGDPIAKLVGHTDSVTGARFTTDGKRILTHSADATARLWSADSGAELLLLAGHAQLVQSAVISAGGERVVTGSFDGSARVWSASADHVVRTIVGEPDELVAWANESGIPVASAAGDRLLVASSHGTPKIRSLRDGSLVRRMRLPGVALALWSPDGEHAAALAADGVRIWRADGASSPPLPDTPGATIAAFSRDGSELAIGYPTRPTEIWSLLPPQRTAVLADSLSPIAIAFSPDRERIAVAARTGNAGVWDAVSGRRVATLSEHTLRVLGVAWSNDGGLLATAGGDDQTARVWDRDGRPVSVLEGNGGTVNSVEFAAAADLVVTASSDNTVKVWSVDHGTLLSVYSLQAAVGWAGFSADGQRLLAITVDSAEQVGEPMPPGYYSWSLNVPDRTPEQLAALVRCRIPFDFVDERVVPAKPKCN